MVWSPAPRGIPRIERVQSGCANGGAHHGEYDGGGELERGWAMAALGWLVRHKWKTVQQGVRKAVVGGPPERWLLVSRHDLLGRTPIKGD